MSPGRRKKIKSLPFPVYFWTVAILTLCGMADSVYLSISHYKVYTDMAYRSFCAISKAINCDTVSQSPYSIFLGVPVAVWGIIGYLFFAMLLPFAWRREAGKELIWRLLLVVSFAYSVYSMILAVISSYYIYSYCIMCIVSYGINFAMLFYVWLIRRRFGGPGLAKGVMEDFRFLWEKRKVTIPSFAPFFICIIMLIFFFPEYWHLEAPSSAAKVPNGITEEGHPWIGSNNPRLVITEFTDYQCFQCRKMHYFLRRLIEKNPEKIRLVHRHFPMDHKFNRTIVPEPFHEGSGEMALLAIYAAGKGRFWEMNDLLFQAGSEKEAIGIRDLARKTGLNYKELSISRFNRKIRYILQMDIWKGMKMRIIGTPSYLINGKVYQGYIPPDIIKKALD